LKTAGFGLQKTAGFEGCFGVGGRFYYGAGLCLWQGGRGICR
jgi:hypothetical protein